MQKFKAELAHLTEEFARIIGEFKASFDGKEHKPDLSTESFGDVINYLYVQVFYNEWTNQEGEINEKFKEFEKLKDNLDKEGVFKDNE